MPHPLKSASKLVQAAVALDEQLRNFEMLVAGAERVPLNSKRNLEKAAQKTTEAARCAESLEALVQALSTSLNEAREQNQRTAAVLVRLGEEIRRRGDEVIALERRLLALAEDAKAITRAVHGLIDAPSDGEREVLPELERTERGLDTLVDGAQQLFQDCKAAALSDLTGELESLKQQLQSARNRVKLLREQLGHSTHPDN